MINLATLLSESASKHPERIAVSFGDTRLSYAQLNGAANQVAQGLVAAGLEPGDRVGLACPNLPFFPIAYYGILKAGGVVAPLNVLLKRREIAFHLDEAACRFFLCFEGSPALPLGEEGQAGFEASACEQLIMITADPAGASPVEGSKTLGQVMHGQAPGFQAGPRDPHGTPGIPFTSGTTGTPKGAELTHSNMTMNAMLSADLLQYSERDGGLVCLPLFHSFGQSVQMNAGIYRGVELVLLPRFTPDAVFKNMQAFGVTCFCGVPTMYWALMSYPKADQFDLATIAKAMRIAVSGGAALPVEVLKGFEERFDVPILEGYGLSETSPAACFNQLHIERKVGSIGKPIWGVEMQIVDDAGEALPAGKPGEVVIRGHNIMKGYFRQEEATASVMKNGWFHTGDVGEIDEDGYFYIRDRTKDMIIRDGFNIYPREIEETLMSHPDISLAAVIGLPDDRHGEEVKAFVVLNEGVEPDEQGLLAWGRKNMATYKAPRKVEFRESLPMTSTGKVLKTELRNEQGLA